MKKTMLLLGALNLSGCAASEPSAPEPPKVIGMPNPAAVYCEEKGGQSVKVTIAQGESADCILPGGERIDEWKLYRRDHK